MQQIRSLKKQKRNGLLRKSNNFPPEKGKTYYVKVIAYKKGKGAVKVFGKASKVKKVKIKK